MLKKREIWGVEKKFSTCLSVRVKISRFFLEEVHFSFLVDLIGR